MTTTTTKAAKQSAKPKKSAPQPKPSAPGLIIHRLELTPEAKRQSETVADHFGMTQIAALSRLVEWFAGMSPEIQAMVMHRGDPTRAILEQVVAGRP